MAKSENDAKPGVFALKSWRFLILLTKLLTQRGSNDKLHYQYMTELVNALEVWMTKAQHKTIYDSCRI